MRNADRNKLYRHLKRTAKPGSIRRHRALSRSSCVGVAISNARTCTCSMWHDDCAERSSFSASAAVDTTATAVITANDLRICCCGLMVQMYMQRRQATALRTDRMGVVTWVGSPLGLSDNHRTPDLGPEVPSPGTRRTWSERCILPAGLGQGILRDIGF